MSMNVKDNSEDISKDIASARLRVNRYGCKRGHNNVIEL
jgi:hypothetical protein